MKNQKKLIIAIIVSIPYVVWRIWHYRGKFGINEILIVLLTYTIVSLIFWFLFRKTKKNEQKEKQNFVNLNIEHPLTNVDFRSDKEAKILSQKARKKA